MRVILSFFSLIETDMFFLAISMVGTDFSLIGRLFPHRARAEIKVKIKALNKEIKHLILLFFFLFAFPCFLFSVDNLGVNFLHSSACFLIPVSRGCI